MDWKKAAKDKADSVLNLIPKEWRIDNIPSVEDQRDVTGKENNSGSYAISSSTYLVRITFG